MPAPTRPATRPPLDLRLLRALGQQPAHGYGLVRDLAAQGPAPDRATVYRRLAALARAGLVAASKAPAPDGGPPRTVYRLSAAGEEMLREELRAALRLLQEAAHARLRAREPRRGGGGRRRGGREPRPNFQGPIVFVSGSRLSGIELRILASMAQAQPRRVHLALPPGVALPGPAPAGVAVVEGAWASLPFRDGYTRLLMVNELPPSRGLARAAREWARVLAPSGTLHVVAPAPLPRGVDPFVDFLAGLHDELFPDQAGAPKPAAVTAALRERFASVDLGTESDQLVWTARSA
jgi:DNA-binding PadR family transcriptional regulator